MLRWVNFVSKVLSLSFKNKEIMDLDSRLDSIENRGKVPYYDY